MFHMSKNVPTKRDYGHHHYVREWRLACKLTLDQVADDISYNKGSLSEIENYKKQLLEWHIYALAELFGIEPAALFRHPETESLDALLRNAPAATRHSIIVMAKALVEDGKKA